MAGRFEEEYQDVLQNIEFAIVGVHREHPEMLDYDVDGALEALVARYTAEQRGRTSREPSLHGLRQDVHAAVLGICEWRLGRDPANPVPSDMNSVEEILACLKRVRSSVQRWTREGGRQGYLTFVRRFL
ncbi:MAG TPA: hypothetical protein VEX86_22495 [Longimicrobium sp.]|nr:hypothetical protein [Longimicrobium sp.]